jgi:hypothetical protein
MTTKADYTWVCPKCKTRLRTVVKLAQPPICHNKEEHPITKIMVLVDEPTDLRNV